MKNGLLLTFCGTLRCVVLYALAILVVASWAWVLYDLAATESVLEGDGGLYRLRSLFLQVYKFCAG